MIILLGFPKSGTTSFHCLFKSLGYNSYHWKKNDTHIGMMIYNNKQTNKPLLNDFLDTDVITQMDVCIDPTNAYWPQLTDYKQIYNENPNSIFILNKRNPKKLLTSFKHWYNMHKRLLTYNPEILQSSRDEDFYAFVDKHYKEVEEFFSYHPSAKFIAFDIETDSIDKLGRYIDLKGITTLPRENIGHYKQN